MRTLLFLVVMHFMLVLVCRSFETACRTTVEGQTLQEECWEQVEVWLCRGSSSQSGREAYASDAPQPAGLLCSLEPLPNVGCSRFRCQVSPRPHDTRDPSSERWNLWARIVRKFCLNVDFHATFRDILHAANLPQHNLLCLYVRPGVVRRADSTPHQTRHHV
jgi:hypothetical protein